jgi:shikimate dehydrogenase
MTAFYSLGLIGYPLEQSLSPQYHGAFLGSLGLAGEYRLYPILPIPDGLEALRHLLKKLRIGEIQGLNVTIPHKQSVLPWLDVLTPTAQAIGAVNTLTLSHGNLVGENTDAAGFLTDLGRFLGGVTPGNALVLGAGGSARAVVYALRQSGWQVRVASRRLEQAQTLAGELLEGCGAFPLATSALAALDPQPDLIVNCTPAGMSPYIDVCPWPEEAPFPPGARVYDLVYNPAETLLVRRARPAGLRAVTGLGMLAEQAALSFELWTGQKPIIDWEQMRKTL